jgi:hypothetical protein
MKGDVDRLTVEPGVELSVEERIRAGAEPYYGLNGWRSSRSLMRLWLFGCCVSAT